MFNRGIDALLNALPTIAGLDAGQIRRMLTAAWLNTTAQRLGTGPATIVPAETLRRLATALEVHAILPDQTPLGMIRACAFVAAEALTIAHERAATDVVATPEEADTNPQGRFWLFGTERTFERVESALLYLIAGYDANAALTVTEIGVEDLGDGSEEGPIAAWAVKRVLHLCRLTPAVEDDPPPLTVQLPPARLRVRHEFWRRIGVHVTEHLNWVTFRAGGDPEAGSALRALAGRLENRDQVPPRPAAHPDLYHLLLLLAAACDETGSRALRTVPPPPDDTGDRFGAYQRQRATTRPLLWPAAQEYAQRTLPGPHAHAVVAVPTNSGKSAVAELAIGQALTRGWVLYLAPTNALVGQIRRQTADVFGRTTAREFLGGAEYTQLAGESLEDIQNQQVLVMTPEKCSLALRQNPDAFADLALCVFDEAHLLGDRTRGVIAELVIAEIMHRAQQAQFLLMSALIANPTALGEWLSQATGTPAIVVDEPWRPTRTLRAIAGVDRARGNTAAQAAFHRLQQLSQHRKRQRFDAPIALLAGLQGAWASQAADDYTLVQTDIGAPVAVTRQGKWEPDGYCTPATAAIVQRLGDRGDKVLAFLPRSKHDSFTAARLTNFADAPQLDTVVRALLYLAEIELGAPSALRNHLQQGVAVHTSALLREEQRASEIAFEIGNATAMYATGTMAQGLNLPATAVVIGGTEIGYDTTSSLQQRRDQTRAQLLNAIGRAGRAHIAPRSMAVVVPNKALVLSSAADARKAVKRAEFLQDEDASSELTSALDGLIADVISGELTVDTLTAAEHTAFSFLSFEDSDEDETRQVVAKTWAVHRAHAQSLVSEVTRGLANAGNAFLHAADAPSWVALAAHQSGIALPETASLYHGLRARLTAAPEPDTIPDWADVMLDLLSQLPRPQLQRLLPNTPYGTSRLANIYSDDNTARTQSWTAYRAALRAWLVGDPIISIADHIHSKPVAANAKRGAQDPIPRTIAITSDAFRFGLPLVAGALAAMTALGRENDPDGPWHLSDDAVRTLILLPLAVRSGANTPEVLGWFRGGVHTRVAAHQLHQLLPAPPGQSDEDLRRWAYGRLSELIDGAMPGSTTPEQDRIIAALRLVREAR